MKRNSPEYILKKAEEAACKTEAELIALGKRRGYEGAVGWGKKLFAARCGKKKDRPVYRKQNSLSFFAPLEYPPGYCRDMPDRILAYKD